MIWQFSDRCTPQSSCRRCRPRSRRPPWPRHSAAHRLRCLDCLSSSLYNSARSRPARRRFPPAGYQKVLSRHHCCSSWPTAEIIPLTDNPLDSLSVTTWVCSSALVTEARTAPSVLQPSTASSQVSDDTLPVFFQHFVPTWDTRWGEESGGQRVRVTYLGVAIITGVRGDPPGTLGGVGRLAAHRGADLASEATGESALAWTLGPGTVRPTLVYWELTAGQQESPRPASLQAAGVPASLQARGVWQTGSTWHNVHWTVK